MNDTLQFTQSNFPELGYTQQNGVWHPLPGTISSLKVAARVAARLEQKKYGKISLNTEYQLLDQMNERSTNNTGIYEDTFMKWCMWDYLTASKKNYEVRSSNLPLPLPNTVQKNMLKCFEPIQEGELRIDEYIEFCSEHSLDTTCTVGEDGTRCVALPEIDLKKKQLVGLVPKLGKNGLPLPNQFPVQNNKEIESYLKSEIVKSSNLYLIMAQSVTKNAAPFCLAAFGTDNKFNHQDVIRRFCYLKKICEKKGVVIIGFSSDQDTKLFKAMKALSGLGRQPDLLPSKWKEFYYALFESEFIMVSDILHYATKTKTRETRKSYPLKMGNHIISTVAYLTILDNSTPGQPLPFCK